MTTVGSVATKITMQKAQRFPSKGSRAAWPLRDGGPAKIRDLRGLTPSIRLLLGSC